MSDYSKPSGYARWGWCIPVIQAALLLWNVLSVVANGFSAWSLAAIIFIGVMCLYTFRMWRQEIVADSEHRARMAELDRRWDAQWDAL